MDCEGEIYSKMLIGVFTIYKEYFEDRLFDINSCKIGQNLLLPYIKLKEYIEGKGGQVHTLDIMDLSTVNAIFFFDLPQDSLITIRNPIQLIAYILKQKWRYDFLTRFVVKRNKPTMVLIICEPPVVNRISYEKKYHKLFKRVYTWDRDLIDNQKYFLLSIPQPLPAKQYVEKFGNRRKVVLMASNKSSKHKEELYSERKKVIRFWENNGLDLYGYGWEKEGYRCYKGSVKNKLDILSKYKFCFCFENMKNVSGYVTEKIFDCFFAGCIPIYYGASDILDIVPKECFIDYRDYDSLQELEDKMLSISEVEFIRYTLAAKQFICSEDFKNKFSIESYINTILDGIGVQCE